MIRFEPTTTRISCLFLEDFISVVLRSTRKFMIFGVPVDMIQNSEQPFFFFLFQCQRFSVAFSSSSTISSTSILTTTIELVEVWEI